MYHTNDSPVALSVYAVTALTIGTFVMGAYSLVYGRYHIACFPTLLLNHQLCRVLTKPYFPTSTQFIAENRRNAVSRMHPTVFVWTKKENSTCDR